MFIISYGLTRPTFNSFQNSSDDEGREERVSSQNLMELDRPLTADETRRLAESWKKRYSAETADRNQPDIQESPQDSIPEGLEQSSCPKITRYDNHLFSNCLVDEENGVRIDVPAFPIPSEPSLKKSSEEGSSSDTEVIN